MIRPGTSSSVGLGFKIEIPEGHYMDVRPRSGLALKWSVTVMNSPGTVDSDYRGEVKVLVFNAGDRNFTIRPGDRIAQAKVEKYEKTEFVVEMQEDLTPTLRGEGGYGSTGT